MESEVHDVDYCLLRDSALFGLIRPNAAGILLKKANISGWYQYWFSLNGSQLLYFERPQPDRRGTLVGTISLFRHKLHVVSSAKRPREFEIIDQGGKIHVFRAGSDVEMHWWIRAFSRARNKIPPPKPFNESIPKNLPEFSKKTSSSEDRPALPRTIVDTHLPVNHLLCVVHGIGASSEILSGNVRQLQESYNEVMTQVFPDVNFRAEMLVVQWRETLTNLDVHKKLQSVVPISPFREDVNPLRDFMVHRIVDYVYYTHERYRRHIMREITSQLNEQLRDFKARRPDFAGKVSVFAHSLGAALCYDLLCRKAYDDQKLLEAEGMRLNFDAENLFVVGSPLGTFIHLDPTVGMGAKVSALPFRMYNIFHPNDPLATRLEPFLDPAMTGVRPVTVPCCVNMGLRESTTQWLGTLWTGGSKNKKNSVSKQLKDLGSTAVQKGSNGSSLANGTTVENGSAFGVAGSDKDKSVPRTTSTGSISDSNADIKGLSNSGTPSRSDTDTETSPQKRRSIGEDPTDYRKLEKQVNAEFRGSNGISISNPAFAGTEMREFLSEELQHEVLNRLRGRRLDFALQLSSTIEEVSTRYSALRAHFEYWSNRDTMLLVISGMMKSTFGIADDFDPNPSPELARRIIDKNIVKKSAEFSDSSDEEGREPTISREASAGKYGAPSLEESVVSVVEKLIHEVHSMHELTMQHPNVLVRLGGVTRSPSIPARASTAGTHGWTSYLPWR